MNQNHINLMKKLVKKSTENKSKITALQGVIRKNNLTINALEENVIDLMESLNLNSIQFKDKETNEMKTLMIDIKTKKETLSKKKIKENCLIYCNGDEERAKELIDYLYDKDARGYKQMEKIIYKEVKLE